MVEDKYPQNKYNFDYKPIDRFTGHTFAPDFSTAEKKIKEHLKEKEKNYDESKLEIEEIVY